MTPTGADLFQTASAWQILAGGSARDPVPVLPRDSVTRIASGNLGMTDTAAVVEALNKQVAADEKKAQDQADAEMTRQQTLSRDATPGAK
jgi:hypothetical protein